MEFGKLQHIENVDFTLPSDHAGTIKVLGGVKANKCSVYVGCPIWSEAGFLGKIYPRKAKSKDFPKYYSQQFNSIELNISHYRPIDKDTIEHWVDTTASDFKFFPKVNQMVSHTPLIKQNADYMKEWMTNNQHFKHKLGMPFLQLPPTYDSTKIDDLLSFCDEIALSRCAIELRHESWFKNEAVLRHLCNYFYKNNITLLQTDTAGRRDVIHQRLTTKTAFIRFVANDLHPTDYLRMNEWITRLKHWIDNGLEEIFFFLHMPTHELMPEIIIYFANEFNKRTGLNLRIPKISSPFTEDQKLF
ncbi:MAG: DUF72 domain-containing protein [Bacteroidetes bacterium]|nr:DUF72 domain-containing protein [Bacteroidota bacterium]